MALTPIMWIIVAVLIALAIVFIYWARKGKINTDEVDYKTYFIIGMCWFPLGIAMDNAVFWIMGLVFLGIGLMNRKKWGKKVKLTKKQMKIRSWIMSGLLIALVLGVLVLFLYGGM